MSASTVTLYRPVGQAEYDPIRAGDMRAFPPRLAHQPIFYPVTDGAYATQIARDRNTRDAASGFVGYATRFRVLATFPNGYTPQLVGGRQHEEYRIPAEGLDAFDRSILGPIEVIATFRPRVMPFM